MSTTPTMFVAIRPDGYGRERFVSLPLVTALVDRTKYFILPPEQPEPPPRETGRGMGHHGARPRARGREVVPLA